MEVWYTTEIPMLSASMSNLYSVLPPENPAMGVGPTHTTATYLQYEFLIDQSVLKLPSLLRLPQNSPYDANMTAIALKKAHDMTSMSVN